LRSSREKILTFSLGATISNKEGTIDTKAVSSISEQFKKLLSYYKVQIIAVVGAGGLGREYTKFARAQLRIKGELDSIGISASRINALLLASVLRNSSILTNVEIPESMSDVNRYLSSGFEAIVLGGLEPGMTCDSTATTIAQANNRSPLVIISTAGGIFHQAGRRKQTILAEVDRSYITRIIRSKPKEHVLDSQTCKVLLSQNSKGMKVLVTGYANIFDTAKELLSTRAKENVNGATRISI
jgi:uridylate kinase